MEVDSKDISLIVQLIDVATARGALRGEEILAIGQLRAKFTNILQEASQQAEPTELTEAVN